MKFPPRWWRRPRCAAPAPHWHRAPGRSAAAARTMCVRGERSGAERERAPPAAAAHAQAPRPAHPPLNGRPPPLIGGPRRYRPPGGPPRLSIRRHRPPAAAWPRGGPWSGGGGRLRGGRAAGGRLAPACDLPPPSPALCRRLRAPSPGSRGGLVVPPRGRLPASRPATAPPQEIPAPAVRGRPGGRGAAGANRRPPAPLSPPFPAAAGVLYPRGGPRGAAAFPLARGRGGRPPRPPRSSRGLRAAARREQGCCRRKGTALQVARQGEPSPCRRPTGKASGLSRLSRLPAEARRTAHFGGRRPEAAR